MHPFAVRRQPTRNRDTHAAAVAQRAIVLHRALAERRVADQHAASLVTRSANTSEALALPSLINTAGGIAVARPPSSLSNTTSRRRRTAPSKSRHRNELFGHIDDGVQAAAGIVAQIDNQADRLLRYECG